MSKLADRLSAAAQLRPGVLRFLALLVTIAGASIALIAGQLNEPEVPQEGQPAPQTYTADRVITVVDEEATDLARLAAAESVPVEFTSDPEVPQQVASEIEDFFAAVSLEAFHEQVKPVEEPPETTTTTTAPTTTTTSTTLAPIEGEEEPATTTSSSTSTTTTSTPTTTTTTTLPVPGREEQEESLAAAYAFLPASTRAAFLDVANEDLRRIEAGESDGSDLLLDSLLLDTIRVVTTEYGEEGIRNDELNDAKLAILARGLILSPGNYPDRDVAADGVKQLVVEFLDANVAADEEATAAARQAAIAAVPDEVVEYVEGQDIVKQGDIVSEIEAQAIGVLLRAEPATPRRLSAVTVVAAVVGLLAAYIRRNRPIMWSQPKQIFLFGLLIILAASAARLVGSFIPEGDVAFGYIMPSAAFGYLAGIIFDTRVAVLLSIPVAVFAGVTTGDIGITVFSSAAVLAPLPFVSRAASMRDLRLAIVTTALLVGGLAASTAWFFTEDNIVGEALLFGIGGGLLGGLIGLGILPYVDNAFSLTTTLTLLDLTDRNHKALRLLEERAPGTFNHSMLVGTLAGRAARAIGANPLLAEAAAYYHDLGKTENPHLFIENQFGAANPHNWMAPDESAAVIRSHVTDGIRLAREYRIPPDVSVGIRQHHGTSLMRYFYHKALEERPGDEVNADDFRHIGQKPQSREMAIVMLCDAIEAAARSLAYLDNPTADGLRKVVEQVVNEKLEDGQLDESDLTFGDLTKVKGALVDALISHYHHRIVYPNFPDSGSTSTEQPE